MMHKELVDVVPTFLNCMKLCWTFYVELMFPPMMLCILWMCRDGWAASLESLSP